MTRAQRGHADFAAELRAPAKSGEAEQGEWIVEVVAGPAEAFGDIGVAGSPEEGDGEVTC